MEADKNEYQKHYEKSISDDQREAYWSGYLDYLTWSKKPNQILDQSKSPFNKWFPDGNINICYNCIDRHLETIPGNKALIYESPMAKRSQIYTFRELHEQVSKLAGVLQKLGVKTGDSVIVYMPMIPEAIFSMFACARIGAVHSVVFGGFGAKELASRIEDAKPKLIISASCGIEPHKTIDYKLILDEAIDLASMHHIKNLIVQRPEHRTNQIENGRDIDYYSAMAMAEPVDCVPVPSTHPLYILYTSGTTGTPKGIVRDTGGTAVALSWTMHHIMDIHKGDVYFSTSDIGWVVGHSFIVYGPLIMGASTVLYEGKPTGTPDPGAYWRLIDLYKVTGMYTAPTALRALRREDSNGDYIKKYDISSLKQLSMAGERCDIHTYEWIGSNLPNTLINDNYWQTESGWVISCNYKNLHTFKSKAGSCTKPAPGFHVKILSEENKEVSARELGRVCIKLPLPPSFMSTLWRNDEAFVNRYLTDSPGYYTSGDAGYFDEDGYLHVMSRLDDIINTAGHRLSTAAMEEVLISHKDIVEAAVVPLKDDLKGEIATGFVVVKQGRNPDHEKLQKELVNLIRNDIGPVAAFRTCFVVEKLPKTRSGKILRNIIRKILNGEVYIVPPTIEDAEVPPKIKKLIISKGFGKRASIRYEEDLDPGSPMAEKKTKLDTFLE